MVLGKVFGGLLQPVCRTLQVLMLAMTRSILWRIWLTARLQALSSGRGGKFRGFSSRGDHAQSDVPLVANTPGW